VDAFTEIYVWLGWWPQQKNQLLREANATTGSSHTNWLRDKKLAMETAQHYVKGSEPRKPAADAAMHDMRQCLHQLLCVHVYDSLHGQGRALGPPEVGDL